MTVLIELLLGHRMQMYDFCFNNSHTQPQNELPLCYAEKNNSNIQIS